MSKGWGGAGWGQAVTDVTREATRSPLLAYHKRDN